MLFLGVVRGSGEVSVLSSWRCFPAGDDRTAYQTTSHWPLRHHELQGDCSAQMLDLKDKYSWTYWFMKTGIYSIWTWPFSSGVQPKPAVSMPEYGGAAVSTGSGFALVGDSLAGDSGAARRDHRITSCPTPVLPAALPATALLGPTSCCVWWEWEGRVTWVIGRDWWMKMYNWSSVISYTVLMSFLSLLNFGLLYSVKYSIEHKLFCKALSLHCALQAGNMLVWNLTLTFTYSVYLCSLSVFQVSQVSTPGFCRSAGLCLSTCWVWASCLPHYTSPLTRNTSSPPSPALPLR